LAKQSAEKDEMNAKSLSTILHLKSVTEKLTQERQLLELQVKSAGQVNVAARLAANAKDRVTDEAIAQRKEFEQKIAALERECEKLKVENEKAIGSLSQKKAEMSDLEKDAATAKARCDELVAESTKQQEEKRKILESLAVAQRETGEASKLITKMRAKGGGGGGTSGFTSDQLETQIKVLKHRLSCPVCNHRDKSCIVLRCRHMFCKPCIDENIKNRSRKCPSCGQRFDTKDIEDIWL
jgi:E3 ubiquitin-protein ligase BRE1